MTKEEYDKPHRKPDWLRVRLGSGETYERTRALLRGSALHTVCEEAMCPNQGLCWEHGRATIMILGSACSRNCRFCNVETQSRQPLDSGEPQRVADAVRTFGLSDVVITSVTRDDLPDGGAGCWAETIRRIRAICPGVMVEILIPDFQGRHDALATVASAAPDVWGHNLETVPAHYPDVRPEADFGRSLDVLRFGASHGFIVKTGLMVGLGETPDEVLAVMHAARSAGVNIFSIGQYLRPSEAHLPVSCYVTPETFDRYAQAGRDVGFDVVISGPLVRSSFYSEQQDRFVRNRIVPPSAPPEEPTAC